MRPSVRSDAVQSTFILKRFDASPASLLIRRLTYLMYVYS